MTLFRLGKRRGETMRSLGALSTAGLAFGMAVVLGVAAGYWLDRWLGTGPWLFLLGFVIGLVAGMINVFRAAGAIGRPKT
jgi:F0F1-type ATP synthase assembly protein I